MLATTENMNYIARNGGRFIAALSHNRWECKELRALVAKMAVSWESVWEKKDDDGKVADTYSIVRQPALSVEGYRVIWFHSTRKAELDAVARNKRVQRALTAMSAICQKPFSPMSRHRQRSKIQSSAEKCRQALLCIYFFALLVQALVERELRSAMAKKGIGFLPLYPEGRPCQAPTTRRVVDLSRISIGMSCR